MALIKYGGGIIQMSGSIAGNTFARNHYGNYVRARTKPINPNSPTQVAQRAALAWLTVRWGVGLSIAQRAAWNLYGSNVAMTNKLGETVYLTGFNHYIRSNSIRKRVGHTILDAAPVVFEIPQQDPTYAISVVAATKTMSHVFDNTMAWANEDDGWMYLFCGQPQNKQRQFFGGPWKLTGAIDGDSIAAPASPAATNTIWEVAAGQHIWSYARISREDGRLSQPFRADVLCGA